MYVGTTQPDKEGLQVIHLKSSSRPRDHCWADSQTEHWKSNRTRGGRGCESPGDMVERNGGGLTAVLSHGSE